jgi:hypothetical protein
MCSTPCKLAESFNLCIATPYANTCIYNVVTHAPRCMSSCMNQQFKFRTFAPGAVQLRELMLFCLMWFLLL